MRARSCWKIRFGMRQEKRQDRTGWPAWGLPRGKLGGATGEGWDRRHERGEEVLTMYLLGVAGRISSRTQEANLLAAGMWPVVEGLNRG